MKQNKHTLGKLRDLYLLGLKASAHSDWTVIGYRLTLKFLIDSEYGIGPDLPPEHCWTSAKRDCFGNREIRLV